MKRAKKLIAIMLAAMMVSSTIDYSGIVVVNAEENDVVTETAAETEAVASTEADTEYQGYGKTTDRLTAEDCDSKHCHESRYGCIDGSGERAVERDIRIGLEISLRVQNLELTNTVEDNHVIVDCVSDDGQDSGDKRLVNVQVERKDSGEQ